MRRARHAEPYLASLSSSFFWISMTIGRLTLGPVADRFGARVATALLIVLALLLQIIFALVPDPIASAVIISIIGYCFGPLFPSGLVMLTRLLPSHLHVGATAFTVFVGTIGAAVIPFAVGALSERMGIQVFQVVIFAWLLITLGLWLSFPRIVVEPSEESETGA
jgi:fucose permease